MEIWEMHFQVLCQDLLVPSPQHQGQLPQQQVPFLPLSPFFLGKDLDNQENKELVHRRELGCGGRRPAGCACPVATHSALRVSAVASQSLQLAIGELAGSEEGLVNWKGKTSF